MSDAARELEELRSEVSDVLHLDGNGTEAQEGNDAISLAASEESETGLEFQAVPATATEVIAPALLGCFSYFSSLRTFSFPIDCIDKSLSFWIGQLPS